jgi:hypothetical protein
MGIYTGTVPTFLAGELLDADKLLEVTNYMTASTSAWTDYSGSLTWVGATTNPVKGNAAIVAKYRRLGKMVQARVSITMGTTTTYGTGFWTVGLPVTPADTAGCGAAIIFDSGVGQRSASCFINGTGVILVSASALVGGAGSTPFTWSTGDLLMFTIDYEAA